MNLSKMQYYFHCAWSVETNLMTSSIGEAIKMTLNEILKKFKVTFLSKSEIEKNKEPDMRTIISDVDISCHSIRREFELYEEEGFFDLDKVYDCLDKIEDHAKKIDDYEEKMGDDEESLK